MKLAEFKRRLMTNPGDRSDEMRAARTREEHAELVSLSDRFEARLKQALDVPVPHALAERIILDQSLSNPAPSRGHFHALQWGAIAATLALAVAITTFNMAGRETAEGPHVAGASVPSMEQLRQHINWHWEKDGPQVLAAAESSSPEVTRVERVFAEFGLQLSPTLLGQVRASNICPAPNGSGAHVVLHTDQGPVTVYYMPRTRLPTSPAEMTVGPDQQVLMINLERGSMALIGPPGARMPDLADAIVEQLEFANGVTF